MNNVALFTGRKKYPEKKYAQNEPIELELVEQESLYIQTPQAELAKELKLQKLEKKSLIAQKKVIESLIQENISDTAEIYRRFQKINLQPPAAIIYTQPSEFNSQQIENIIKSIGKEFTIDTKPVQNLCNQEILQYYHTVLKDIDLKLDYINYSIQLLNKLLSKNNSLPQFKTIPTYNGLGYTMTKSQHELIVDLLKKQKSENDKITLQEILVKHVMKDKDFTIEQKEEILDFIDNNKSNKIIENCLMFPLTRDEKRVLRALREEIYEQIQTGQIATTGLTVYEAYIFYDKFFTLYGVSNDDKTTKHIKDILFGRSSKGLRKHIIVEDKQAISTQLILNIEETKGKINLFKKDVGKGFIITMPSFLFVGEDKLDAKNYYNQENEGYRRFMKIGNMAQSDAASNIACKLEMLCHSTLHNKKKKDIRIDLETMVNIAGYQKRYKGMPKETKVKIDKILNNMIKAEYLIESWQLTKGKYGQGQYIIKPLKIS